ncbi:hypothetical protein [Novosphingobium sp. JCM 18896]|uniref:hypothetical protein n=1 Tax=Novosphingobium sp. JCM 18896 TaxID=2989731 RepID=UPI0022229BC4|nr:hypothetical protein [Novosphingobium sp. JCM 18896]MCW1429155.1 hypothetical protein [Novosphingobium sp. JCM 18896]
MSDFDRAFDRLAARLLAKARALAAQRELARRDDPRRWRRAGLLWPLFGKD